MKMKAIFILIAAIVVSVLFTSTSIPVYADAGVNLRSEYGFKVVEAIPTDRGFVSYDVNDEGLVLITLKNIDMNVYVAVISTEGQLMQAFCVRHGGSVTASWQEEGVGIYFARGNDFFIVDMEGVLLSSEKYDDGNAASKQYSDPYSAYAIKTRQVAGATYKADDGKNLSDGVGSSLACEKLVRVDAEGNEYILYQSTDTSTQMPPWLDLLLWFGLGPCVGIIVVAVFWTWKKRQKSA